MLKCKLSKCVEAKEILQGMLGANVIGFQNFGYARHFTNSCTRLLGCEISQSTVDNAGVPVNVSVQPIGIDAARIRQMQESAEVKERVEALKELFAGKRVILGIESVDQHRGFIHKLQALQHFYEDNPEMRGSVTLIQILLPAPDPNFRVDPRAVDLVSKINAEFGSLEFTPIQFYYQAVENEEYLALLKIADVFLITSERDSVNTTFLDYIASQSDTGNESDDSRGYGLPIVSEFIGSASILPANLQVNPWDHRGIAAVLNSVLAMCKDERKNYHDRISKFVNANSARHWVTSFLSSIVRSSEMLDIYQPTPFLSFDRLVDRFMNADRRLILMDYDGTLTPIRQVPSAALPSAELTRALRHLTADPKNQVYVISGRDQAFLEACLGNIPQLGMSAEHGCFLRPTGDMNEVPNWMCTINIDDLVWKDDVLPIMEYYTERTPGSFVEQKKASLTWHYRLADPEFGSWQAKELQTHLEQSIASKYAVEIIAGKKNLEVRPTSSNKGEIIKSLLVRHGRPNFILCAGDDKTDEDMFRALTEEFSEGISPTTADEWCFTCSIGHSSKKTLAKYHVNTPEQIVAILMRLCSMTANRLSGVTM